MVTGTGKSPSYMRPSACALCRTGFSPSSRNITAMRTLMVLLFAAAPALALPPHEAASAARDWRVKHEKEIVAELSALVAIPNLASDKANIERNAAALVEAFTRRGAKVKLLRIEGAPPLVVATVKVGRVLNPSSAAERPLSAAEGSRTRPTFTFYAHYDGQPVD